MSRWNKYLYMLINTDIKQDIVDFLQTYVKFYIEQEREEDHEVLHTVIKKGNLINYGCQMPYWKFKLDIRGTHRHYFFPFPYSYERISDEILAFDYRNHHLDYNNPIIANKIRRIGCKSESKVYNRVLYIKSFKTLK